MAQTKVDFNRFFIIKIIKKTYLGGNHTYEASVQPRPEIQWKEFPYMGECFVGTSRSTSTGLSFDLTDRKSYQFTNYDDCFNTLRRLLYYYLSLELVQTEVIENIEW